MAEWSALTSMKLSKHPNRASHHQRRIAKPLNKNPRWRVVLRHLPRAAAGQDQWCLSNATPRSSTTGKLQIGLAKHSILRYKVIELKASSNPINASLLYRRREAQEQSICPAQIKKLKKNYSNLLKARANWKFPDLSTSKTLFKTKGVHLVVEKVVPKQTD